MHFYQFDEWEFYDLKSDPDEYNNLYNNPEYQSLVKRMKNQLNQLEKKYEDDSDMTVKPKSWQNEVRGIAAN
jgi:hypothetical protein